MSLRLDGKLARPDRAASGDFCPIDRAMQVVGTRSAILLLREASYGTTRFDDFVTRVGLSEAVASSRLRMLVDAGLLERRPYQEHGQRTRHEYVLTDSGADLVPALLALADWGRRHLPRDRTPSFTHDACGAEVSVTVTCAEGHDVATEDIVVGA